MDDDEPLLRDFSETFSGPLFAYAYRATGDRQRAEDVVQETLARAWERADRFDPSRGSAGAWLFTIARNLLIDGWRAEAARPRTAPLGDADVTLGVDEVDRALEAWQMAEALRRISPEHRAVIVETYYGARSVAATAARLGIPEGTVKSRLYYGLRALRLVLEELEVVR
jgi:RNA polymerase sigma-70 factor (ECF subfamily)